MKKKALIPAVLIVVIAAAAGGWFWWSKAHPIEGSVEDYIIKTLETGQKIVENKKAGLTFQVPEGWVEEKIDELEGFVTIHTPDTQALKSNNIEPPLKTGCFIAIATIYEKKSFEEMKEEINDMHFGLGIKSEEFEIIPVNNQQALKNTYDTVDLGKGTAVYIPYKNRFYSFAAYAGPDDEEQCLEDFNTFLSRISYK